MKDRLRIDQWAFAAFVAALPIASVGRVALFGNLFKFADLVFVAAAVVFGVGVLAGYRRIIWDPIYIPLALYAAAVTVSAWLSEVPALSLPKLAGKYYLIAIVVLAINVIDSAAAFRKVVIVWVTASAVVVLACLAGIAAFYVGFRDPETNLVLHKIYGSLPPGPYPRIEGFFEYPAMLCNYLAISWMLTLLAYSTGWLRGRLYWVVAPAMLTADAFTLTPGLGGLFLSTGILAWIRLRGSGRTALARVCLAAGIVIAIAFLAAASVRLFAPGAPYDVGGPSHRAIAWKTSFASFLDAPLVGRGPGVPVAHSEFVDPSGNRQLLTDAHNTALSILGETGIVGLVPFVLLAILIFFRLCEPSTSSVPYVPTFLLALALLDSLLYQGLTGSYEDSRPLWTVFGLAAAVFYARHK